MTGGGFVVTNFYFTLGPAQSRPQSGTIEGITEIKVQSVQGEKMALKRAFLRIFLA